MPKTFAFLSVFFCVQQFEHTNLFFSLLYFAFVMLSVIGFNIAEGFTRLTGAYIFWYSTLIVIIGVTWKAAVGEAADSNLYSPVLDMALYTASMVTLVLVTLLNKKMDFRSMGLGGGFSSAELNYSAAGLGCLIVWFGIIYADVLFGQAPGGLESALIQVNVFGPLGLILSTIGAIKDSGGRRSTNAITIIAFGYVAYLGLLSFSKQQMITPMVCWVVGVVYARLRIRFIHIVAVILMLVGSFWIISPLSASRDLAEDLDTTARLELVGYLITHRSVMEEHVTELAEVAESSGVGQWYSKPQGSLIERLSMIPPDDELFSYTSQGHYEGIAPVVEYFGNLAPHFISPNKHVTFSGNYYAHEMGYGLAADDFTTGISFSPVAEAYHCEGWGGVFWLLPLLWVMLFSSADFIVSDMAKYPWGLLVVVYFAHAAPEQLLGGIIYFLGYGNFGMLLAIIVVTRIAPVLGALFTGRSVAQPSRALHRVRPVLSQPQG